MDSVVMQILTWALPSGFLSSVVTWLVTRRQRNNDFLASLQKSIDLLTEKYTETLNENVRLQAVTPTCWPIRKSWRRRSTP